MTLLDRAPESVISPTFEQEAKKITIPWGPIGESNFKSRYARPTADGIESWFDVVSRVVNGNCGLVDPEFIEPDERIKLFRLMYGMKIVPAGRHLRTTGTGEDLFSANCFVSVWTDDPADHHCWVMDHLMIGGGIGDNYSANVRTSTPIKSETDVELNFSIRPDHPDFSSPEEVEMHSAPLGSPFYVPDTREGWVHALRMLFDIHSSAEHSGALSMDFSAVRPSGAPISGCAGVASGPGPLIDILAKVNRILNNAHGRALTAIECMEIDHFISEMVIFGGVRRSARLSCMAWDDPEIMDFIDCKSGADGEAHFSTNISVALDELFWDQLNSGYLQPNLIFESVVKNMLINGEPGFVNLAKVNETEEQTLYSCNPCGEQFLAPGESCVLGHVNLAAFPNESDRGELLEAFRLMGRFLLRSTERRYLDDIEEAATKRTRRIGAGFFGLQTFAALNGVKYSEIPDSPFMESTMSAAADEVMFSAAQYALDLGWSTPAKYTSIAPTGTIASMPGETTGCETVVFAYYNRLVRHQNGSPELESLIAQGYRHEPCIYSANTTVVYMPTKDKILDSVPYEMVEEASDVSVEDHLRVQVFLQRTFADNAISKTIIVEEDQDQEEIAALLREYLPELKGVTMFRSESRPQSPYQRLTPEEFAEETRLVEAGVGYTEQECIGAACPI